MGRDLDPHLGWWEIVGFAKFFLGVVSGGRDQRTVSTGQGAVRTTS